MRCGRSPAVVAGLLGVAAIGAPAPALATEGALPLDALAGIGLPYLDVSGMDAEVAGALGVSFAGGVLVTIGTYALVRVIARGRSAASQGGAGPADGPADGGAEPDVTPRATHVPRHMRPDDWERVSRLVAAKGAKEALANSGDRGMHAARDYEDIAENYVGRQSFRQRMATRAQGVAATLSARIGANRMEGLPVIERADGSVGDVGTTWWAAAVGPSISGPIGAGVGAEDAIPSEFGADGMDDLQFMSVGPRDISRRVAVVEEGAYPEKRSVEDVAGDDWDRALKAMDERLHAAGPSAAAPAGPAHAAAVPAASTAEAASAGSAHAAPAPAPAAPKASVAEPIEPFWDCVGDEDSLDEPDGLERDTQFLHFRLPAGHPEVVDTESYIDYLVAEEFSRNPSAAVRRSSRDYLRVIEGGTQTSAMRVPGRHMAPERRGGAAAGGYRPRHLAGEPPVPRAEALEA
ncbi:MAG: hypothetical protein MR874_01480 [Coriobacteriaceae bacterium]|nr:hypothetical protein [Coriobacteriaceae bacterium]